MCKRKDPAQESKPQNLGGGVSVLHPQTQWLKTQQLILLTWLFPFRESWITTPIISPCWGCLRVAAPQDKEDAGPCASWLGMIGIVVHGGTPDICKNFRAQGETARNGVFWVEEARRRRRGAWLPGLVFRLFPPCSVPPPYKVWERINI